MKQWDLSIAATSYSYVNIVLKSALMLFGSEDTAALDEKIKRAFSKPTTAGLGAAVQKLSATELRQGFCSPPAAFRPVPFYWWTGEPLDRGRIAWQLDRLKEKGICQVVVSYSHGTDGATETGKPPLFSREWWELFRWFLSQCREREMTAGFQDYTLTEPTLREIGARTPGMRGGQMVCVRTTVSGPASV